MAVGELALIYYFNAFLLTLGCLEGSGKDLIRKCPTEIRAPSR